MEPSFLQVSMLPPTNEKIWLDPLRKTRESNVAKLHQIRSQYEKFEENLMSVLKVDFKLIAPLDYLMENRRSGPTSSLPTQEQSFEDEEEEEAEEDNDEIELGIGGDESSQLSDYQGNTITPDDSIEFNEGDILTNNVEYLSGESVTTFQNYFF